MQEREREKKKEREKREGGETDSRERQTEIISSLHEIISSLVSLFL